MKLTGNTNNRLSHNPALVILESERRTPSRNSRNTNHKGAFAIHRSKILHRKYKFKISLGVIIQDSLRETAMSLFSEYRTEIL